MNAVIEGKVVQVDDPKANKAGVQGRQIHIMQSGKYQPEIVSILSKNGWLPKVGDAVKVPVLIRLFEGEYGSRLLVSYVPESSPVGVGK